VGIDDRNGDEPKKAHHQKEKTKSRNTKVFIPFFSCDRSWWRENNKDGEGNFQNS